MKLRTNANVQKNKVVAVWALFTTAVLITLMGAFYFVYSILNGVTFTVMQAEIPGAVFGAVIAFLGVRYILSVRKLREKLFATQNRFSWRNFKA
jgi:hypothetical protein